MNCFDKRVMVICTLPVILNGSAFARDIYKWTDADGRVHYSDRPAATVSQSLEIRQLSAPAPAAAASPGPRISREKLLRAYEEERAIEKKEAAERMAQKQLRAKNCLAARTNLEAYRNARYLYEEDENGERRVLSFSERDAATEEMQKSVDFWCDKS